ncbi:MAG: glycosyltransferase [Planctomycetota bacterium]
MTRFLGFRPDGTIAPHVSDDMNRALQRLGHEVLVIKTQQIHQDAAKVGGLKAWEPWIARIRDFAPQAALFYGTSGIVIFSDRHKAGGHLLADLDIPVVPCFFDDPLFVLGIQNDFGLPKDTPIFVWDRGHLAAMGAAGFTRLQHLPLGTDPHVFKPLQKPQSRYQHALAFVGSLAKEDAFQKALADADPVIQDLFRRALGLWDGGRARPFATILRELSTALDNVNRERWKLFEASKGFWHLVNALNQTANRHWRSQVVGAVAGAGDVGVYGGDTWGFIGQVYKGGIDYHGHLPRLYASTPLHLNLTAPQIMTGVNNRVWDVLASGSMVLTDAREELLEEFEEGKEILVFRSAEEALELSRHWASREPQLREMARRGRDRVLARHTWDVRMKLAIDRLGEWGIVKK